MVRFLRSVMIAAVLAGTITAHGASPIVAQEAARPMSVVEMAAAEGGLSAFECFLLGVALALVCAGTGGTACAGAILAAAGTGGLDCLS